MMLSCKHASQLLSQSLDRRLTLRERVGLRLHLMVCDVCERFGKQLAQIRSSVHAWTRQVEQDEHLKLSEEAKKRIASAIESKRSS